jgi:hypothetical protein
VTGLKIIRAILAILFFALGTLLLSVFSSFAYDIQRGKADRLPPKQVNRYIMVV